MVVSNTFNFYPDTPTRPLTSDSRQHITAPSYSSMDAKKGAVEVNEIPLNQIPSSPPPSEKPLAKSETLRRSQELARPKRKPKPRPFDRVGRSCSDQSIVIKGTIIAAVTAIPFVVFLLIALFAFPSKTPVGEKDLGVTLVRLAKWLLVSWGSFIGLLYCGRIVAMFAAYLCTLSSASYRFRGLARECCLRLTLMLWAGVGYAIMPNMFNHSHLNSGTVKAKATDWVNNLRRAFMFLIIAFAIIFVQGVLLELIKIQYIEGFIGPRAEKASNELEVIKDLNNLVDRHISSDDISILTKLFNKLFLPTNSNDLYYIISRGEGDEEKWNEYAANIWSSITNGRTFLTMSDLSQQLIAMNRDPERGRDLFLQLDESCDGQITEDEVTRLVHRIGLMLNRRTQAMTGIQRLMQKLEIVLTILVLGLIVFLYVQFFEQDYAKNIGSLWTGIVGLAFAFSGAVSEFVNSSVFCFGKHPYDIGDFVELKGKKFIVSNIFLTHTNFEQVQNEHVRGLATQISHAALATEPIINWTRTVEDATRRHAKAEDESGARDVQRNDHVAELVTAKLEHLRGSEVKVKGE
ncbi:hypothetical protein LTS08_001051 [Lithohypha guttulata]|uniref:EF-hand domain-containing protein n=1 Tax=Lithohypha guttulata TaxID=1690604 RepID=A0AAN7Y7Y9_9EURO|nr:hypothetical protein LTR05_002763 [Lithohypha guttulata]KAK5106928.1 hypothetical protein LTS08_001051 [Lithohypha guttulata]